jgi:hypothetical protein
MGTLENAADFLQAAAAFVRSPLRRRAWGDNDRLPHAF